jgi:branched-chain amino acid transport system permease protein
MLLFGLALVAMMLYRPAGLFPSSVRRRELARRSEDA